MEVKCYLKAKKLIAPILLFVFDKNLADFVTILFCLVSYINILMLIFNNIRNASMLGPEN